MQTLTALDKIIDQKTRDAIIAEELCSITNAPNMESYVSMLFLKRGFNENNQAFKSENTPVERHAAIIELFKTGQISEKNMNGIIQACHNHDTTKHIGQILMGAMKEHQAER